MELYKFIEKIKERGIKAQGFGSVIGIIKKNPILLHELEIQTKFLDGNYSNISASQRFYHIWFNMNEIEKCPYCNLPKKFIFNDKFSPIRYEKKDANYCGTCGNRECSKEYNKKRSADKMKEKYGTFNHWEIPGYREKLEKTNVEKYGSKYFVFSEEGIARIKKTLSEKYGGHHMKNKEYMDKQIQTNMERYGVKSFLEKKDEIKKGMLKKYGVEYPNQSPEILEKTLISGRKYKKMELPSGLKINVQGYEEIAINLLLKDYKEDDMLIGPKKIIEKVGKIPYNFKGNLKYYNPDLYIKSKNLIIEVKSKYTYEKELDKNLAKMKGCLDKGLLFMFMIL